MEPEPPFEVIAAFDYAKEGNHEVGFSAGDLIRCLRSGINRFPLHLKPN